MSTPRAEPPLVADEGTSLRSWLTFHRDTFRQKTAGLSTEQLHATHPPTTLTLGGLVKHLAYVEDNWAGVVLLGRDPVEPWAGADWQSDHDWEFTSAREDDADVLHRLWSDAVAASDVVYDEAMSEGPGALDRLSARPLGERGPCDLRWILVHLIEEYARHNGHADLLREAVDGEVGV